MEGTNRKPATPLPWVTDNRSAIYSKDGTSLNAPIRYERQQDAAYIVHAANVLPVLIQTLREIVAEADRAQDWQPWAEKARNILFILGEGE